MIAIIQKTDENDDGATIVVKNAAIDFSIYLY